MSVAAAAAALGALALALGGAWLATTLGAAGAAGALALALALGGAWLARRWARVRRYWADRGVPHLPPHPILGSLTFLQQKNAGLWMRDLYDSFGAPYAGMWLFWRPALVVQCPALARRVLVKDADNFRDRFLTAGAADPIGSLNLFTVNDPTWSAMRRRLTVMFTSAKLRGLHALLAAKSKELTQRISNEIDQKKKIDLRTVYADFTTDVIGAASFGVGGDATLTGSSAMREVTKDFAHFTVWRGLSWTSIFFLPELVDIFRFSLFPKAATDYFKKIFRAVVAQRGGYGGAAGEAAGGDLMDALIKIKRDAQKENEDISENMLVSQAAIFVQGGFDTSASGLTFASYELAHKPETQEKLYLELKEAQDKIGDADLDMSTLAALPYLNAVIKETLRKYPAMGWLDRLCAREYVVDERLTLPAGTPVYVNAMGFHYDPEFFPEPHEFVPERFLPENEAAVRPFTYMPFGEGPRNCVGLRFGHNTMRYALAAVVLRYRVSPLAGAPPPRDIELEKRGLFLTPGGLLAVRFTPRDAAPPSG